MAESIPLSKANTSFTLALFKKLCDADKSANIFYSPFSISSALAMVMLGARGNTAAQMSEVLCFAEPKKQPEAEEQLQQQQSIAVPPHLLKKGDDGVHSKFAELLRELNKPDAAYSLSVANRLYGEKSYQIVENYLSETKKYYHAELESVDFKTSHEPARVKINDWVKDKTQGKIQDLLPEGVVDSLTRLVLVNAIYFKGKWNHQFKESQTVDAEFRINKDEKKTVKMMKQTNDFPFTSIPEINCKVLELPYVGKELSMLIFLPDETEDGSAGLERLEKELTCDKFVEWTRPDRMGEAEVVVSLPRFKMEEKYDLNEVLISMGMVDAFDAQKSNLSGMSAANDLVVSKVVHKSYVDVNEEGTEAAAATGVVITLLCYIPPVIFNADHPFLFFIRHNSSSSILFAGRYCSPN